MTRSTGCATSFRRAAKISTICALDAAERSALGSNDRAVRKEAYWKIQSILAERVPAVITWYNRRISVANSDLKNYRPAHAVTSFWNSYEWQI